MKEPVFRLLTADEIECRVGVINEKGLSLLLYKDARLDPKILDETFGIYGWQRTHEEINGNLYCTISIWDEEKGQWIAKQDVGTKSDYEQEKGQASDSFKRAAVCAGIGRELYTAPFIWVPVGQVEIQLKGQKYVTKEHFSVKEIDYNDRREINLLMIVNSRGNVVFSKKPRADTNVDTQKSTPTAKPEEKLTPKNMLDKRKINQMKEELERTGVGLEIVLGRYNLQDISQMTLEIYQDAMKGLKKTRTKDAA